jgi:hypothetical protein
MLANFGPVYPWKDKLDTLTTTQSPVLWLRYLYVTTSNSKDAMEIDSTVNYKAASW